MKEEEILCAYRRIGWQAKARRSHRRVGPFATSRRTIARSACSRLFFCLRSKHLHVEEDQRVRRGVVGGTERRFWKPRRSGRASERSTIATRPTDGRRTGGNRDVQWKKKRAEFGGIQHRCSLQRSKTTNRPCFLVSCAWEWPSGQRTVQLRHPVVKGLAPTTDSRSAFQHPKQMQILQPSNTSWERQEQEREGAEENQAVASEPIDENGRWRDLDPWIPPWKFLSCWE